MGNRERKYPPNWTGLWLIDYTSADDGTCLYSECPGRIVNSHDFVGVLHLHNGILPANRRAKSEFLTPANVGFEKVGLAVHQIDYSVDTGPVIG